MNATTQHDLTLAQAAAILPRKPSGKPVATNTVKRWIVQGVGGVRLDGCRIGGVWFTSQAAIQAFIRETTTKSCPSGERTPAQSDRDAAAAVERMKQRYGRGQKKRKAS